MSSECSNADEQRCGNVVERLCERAGLDGVMVATAHAESEQSETTDGSMRYAGATDSGALPLSLACVIQYEPSCGYNMLAVMAWVG